MITISKKESHIVVSGYGFTYTVHEDTPAINAFGRETGNTVGEEYEAGKLYAYDDNVHGESHGLHGALYAA